jgi:hypothetical protein
MGKNEGKKREKSKNEISGENVRERIPEAAAIIFHSASVFHVKADQSRRDGRNTHMP